jgi:hypothetical protein
MWQRSMVTNFYSNICSKRVGINEEPRHIWYMHWLSRLCSYMVSSTIFEVNYLTNVVKWWIYHAWILRGGDIGAHPLDAPSTQVNINHSGHVTIYVNVSTSLIIDEKHRFSWNFDLTHPWWHENKSEEVMGDQPFDAPSPGVVTRASVMVSYRGKSKSVALTMKNTEFGDFAHSCTHDTSMNDAPLI